MSTHGFAPWTSRV